ncbi:hypothetical protein ACJ41O_001459 [Fusarium nematophilum]
MAMNSLVIPILLLFLAAVIVYAAVYPFLSESFSPLRRLPGPLAARFSRLWYLRQVSTGQFHFINVDLHKKHGSIVRIAPGQYSINDPRAMKQIYGIGKGFAKASISAWYTASSAADAPFKDLFTDTNSARHAANRRLVANLYSTTTLRSMEPDVEDCIRLCVNRLEGMAKSGVSLDLQFWMQCYAFDVICQITVGRRFGFLDTGTDQLGMFPSLHEYLKYCALVGVEHEWHNTLWWFMTKLPARGMVYVARFTAEQISKVRGTLDKTDLDRSNVRQDFLSKLLRLQQENPEKCPDSAIIANCLTNIGAGSDTTSISLCAIINNLAAHPHALQKLREEVDAKFRDLGYPEFIPFPDTQTMGYLQACIKEALRLHPATGLPLARVVPEGGATISGTFFPAGNVVGVNTWVVHRNRDIFGSDVDEFRPERWLDQTKERLSVMEANWLPASSLSESTSFEEPH